MWSLPDYKIFSVNTHTKLFKREYLTSGFLRERWKLLNPMKYIFMWLENKREMFAFSMTYIKNYVIIPIASCCINFFLFWYLFHFPNMLCTYSLNHPLVLPFLITLSRSSWILPFQGLILMFFGKSCTCCYVCKCFKIISALLNSINLCFAQIEKYI